MIKRLGKTSLFCDIILLGEVMSKCGKEEKETLEVINEIGFLGDVLDVAAGDGRFLLELLNKSRSVTAIDIDKKELEMLKENCAIEYRNKLKTEIVDITKRFPYQDETYDTIFCTGTLHLFDKSTIASIIREMNRCLKQDGTMILDFATDIRRLDCNDNEVVFESEGSYGTDDAIALFHELLNNCSLDIQKATFKEDNLDEAGYNSIAGNFLIVTAGKVKRKINHF